MLSDCDIAVGSPIVGGYILIYVASDKRQYLAHRLAWIQAHGPIPEGMYVCHRCDTPACRNVEHLFLGTATDNNRDALAKGRAYKNPETCRRGHNEWSIRGGARRCLACHREMMRRNRRDKAA